MFREPQVNFYSQDVEASLCFYRDLFGFVETFRTPNQGEPVHAELRLGDLVLGFASVLSLGKVHGIVTGEGPPRAELVVWTDHVDEAYASLLAKGVRPLRAPHDFLDALRAAWVEDPDGNPVQIVQRRTLS